MSAFGKKGKVAIVCDDYKLTKFREELDKKKFVYTEQAFTKGTTAITILTYDQEGVKQAVTAAEGFFNDKKAKNN